METCMDLLSVMNSKQRRKKNIIGVYLHNAISTFLVGFYILHQDSNFYIHLEKDQTFANLEDDNAYFKYKGGVIAIGETNAHTRIFQLDAQEPFRMCKHL